MGGKCCKRSGRGRSPGSDNLTPDPPGNPRILHIRNRQEFDSIIGGNDGKIVVVDFYAPWCGPCKAIAPKLDLCADEYADTVLFIKVNVDKHDELAAFYGITSMPTFIFFKKGEKVDEFSEANVDKLRERIERHSSKL